LAALLWESQSWQPLWRGDRPQLSAADNRALSEWQDAHLRVGWVAVPEPWRAEVAIIGNLRPPMNLAANRSHPFHATMSEARARLRAAALGIQQT
jgi:hypothetical protein